MSHEEKTTAFLRQQCCRYPKLQVEDLLKALHQSTFGCGHFVSDQEQGLELLRQELAGCCGPGDCERLDGPYCRLHLGYLVKSGLSPETLMKLFVLSAREEEEPEEQTAALEKKLSSLEAMAAAGELPFSAGEVSEAVAAWRSAGFPPCHHSAAFRTAYAPAYRVIRQEFVWILPLLSGIDRCLAGKTQVIVALEGGSASGKTSLAAFLASLYDCNVFHMDDFFLQPHQRTPQRLAQPGGNVDRERFFQEVLQPLTQGLPVRYRAYDCHSQTLGEEHVVPWKPLNIVEGAYSMHPMLADGYDLSAFLQIDSALQRSRIQKRNSPDVAERFFSTWIPLENAYFDAFATARRCSMILEVPQ